MLFHAESDRIEDRVVVVNKYRVRYGYTDIMRGSPLGNPSSVQKRSRSQALDDFDSYLRAELRDKSSPVRAEMERLLKLILDGEKVRLGCCCKPKDCHGDIIRARLIKEAYRRVAKRGES